MSLLAINEMVEPLTQFGVAGLMGLLWVWERMLTRRREAQLDAAHKQLERKAGELRLLVRTINRNTRVIERFEQTQRGMARLLERISDEQTGSTKRDAANNGKATDGRDNVDGRDDDRRDGARR